MVRKSAGQCGRENPMSMSDPIWSYGTFTTKPNVKSILAKEEAAAREQNGHVVQKDWPGFFGQVAGLDMEKPEVSNLGQFLKAASPDEIHVAALTKLRAHLDDTELLGLLQSSDCDASTILWAYVAAISGVIETHYTMSSPFAHLPFIKNGVADFDGMEVSEITMRRLAELWRERRHKREIVFDVGRKQMVYAALEADLRAAGLVPDWFIPSDDLKPFAGRQANCAYYFFDYEVRLIPPGLQPPLD